MTVQKTGVTTGSPDKLLIDAGAIYLGFNDVDNPGTLLGATRGGNSFELTRTIRQMEVDGARGPVKNFRRVEDVMAQIKANMFELTAENLRRSIADAIYSAGTKEISEEAVGEGDGSATFFHVGTLIDDCEASWDTDEAESAVAGADGKQKGTNAVKVVVLDGASAGILCSNEINVDDLENYNKLHIHIKANIDIAAEALQVLLSDSALGADPEATVKLPALVADKQYHLMVDADLSGCSVANMISVALEQTVDLGACEIIIDEIKASAQNIEENSETITCDGALTRGEDYTMDYANGEIQFVTPPADGHAIVASYDYVNAAATIGGETTEANLAIIKDAAYIDNVAIVGTITKFDGTAKPIIIKIINCLCDTAFSLTLAPKDEAVPEVTFTAHYAANALDTEPWQILYPSA